MVVALAQVMVENLSVFLDWVLRLLIAVGIPAFLLNEWGKRRDLRVQFFTQDKKRVCVAILLTLSRMKRVLSDMQRIGNLVYSKEELSRKLISLQIAIGSAGMKLDKEFNIEAPLRAGDSESLAGLVLTLWHSFSPSLEELQDELRDLLEEAEIYVDDDEIKAEMVLVASGLTSAYFTDTPDKEAIVQLQGRLMVLRARIIDDVKQDFKLRERFSFSTFVAAQGKRRRG